MKDQSDTPSWHKHAQGPFTLAGPVARADPRRLPLRGDLAHIGLAGKHFVPHYAVPQPRGVLPGGAALFADTGESAEELCTLLEGDSFEMLDIAGGWDWPRPRPRYRHGGGTLIVTPFRAAGEPRPTLVG